MLHVFSTFSSEITNKNCHVTFFDNPPPPKCHVLFEWSLSIDAHIGDGEGGGGPK
jgi:hypothetical protein